MIRETIVTTLAPNGIPHIAPIGVIVEEGGLVIAPFRPSSTLDNLLAGRQAVINYVDDVRIFAASVCGLGRDWPTRPAEKVNGAILEAALSYDEVEVVEFRDDETRPRLLCRSLGQVMIRPFLGFNRAQAAVVEASILVSRLDRLPRHKVEQEMAYLAIAVEKTAGEREREAWGWLATRIGAYLAATQAQS